MHTKRASLARTILGGIAAGLALLLSGCGAVVLTNLTPPALPDNASEIYTFTLRVSPRTNVVEQPSITPRIVVDGQSYLMKPSSLPDIWEFDYQIPAGRTEIAYYYLVDYQVAGNNGTQAGEAYTGLQHAEIVRRYVAMLDSNRGPVGARVGVLGRGFTPEDQVAFNGQPVGRTTFESPNSLSFLVPALPPGVYQVSVTNSGGSSPVGSFRIDASGAVTASPSELTLTSGQSAPLTFTIASPAPAGGLLLDVATDVPESVIMPEVVVPEGQTSVTVTVTGGRPGSGSLVLRGPGSGLTIPVSVSPR
ncbi:MAG TPA: IPT/TIG domain-containing protein [Opitutaceae bacterium]|jgi:hypothetical protein|nr:IPT/TIG domain-containing protein [Opitutaceae bacterium]